MRSWTISPKGTTGAVGKSTLFKSDTTRLVTVAGASGVLGVVVGLIVTWFALILSFGVVAAVFFITMVTLIVVGIMCVVQSPLVGVAVIGIALLCGGIGILFMMLTVTMAGIATPAMYRGIVKLWHKLFDKKQNA